VGGLGGLVGLGGMGAGLPRSGALELTREYEFGPHEKCEQCENTENTL